MDNPTEKTQTPIVNPKDLVDGVKELTNYLTGCLDSLRKVLSNEYNTTYFSLQLHTKISLIECYLDFTSKHPQPYMYIPYGITLMYNQYVVKSLPNGTRMTATFEDPIGRLHGTYMAVKRADSVEIHCVRDGKLSIKTEPIDQFANWYYYTPLIPL